MTILALTEMAACERTCGGGGEGDSCVAIAGVTREENLMVVEYCVPKRLDMGVEQVLKWTVADSNQWSATIKEVHFIFTGNECEKLLLNSYADWL